MVSLIALGNTKKTAEGALKLTQKESEHIRERPGRVEHNVELRCLQRGKPSCCPPAQYFLDIGFEYQQCAGVEEAEHGAHDELGMSEAEDGYEVLA